MEVVTKEGLLGGQERLGGSREATDANAWWQRRVTLSQEYEGVQYSSMDGREEFGRGFRGRSGRGGRTGGAEREREGGDLGSVKIRGAMKSGAWWVLASGAWVGGVEGD